MFTDNNTKNNILKSEMLLTYTQQLTGYQLLSQ